MVIMGRIRAPNQPNVQKLSAYECGFDTIASSRPQFNIQFYLVALLFIVFDLEIAFLFPWAITLNTIGIEGFITMMIFLLILLVGFLYEWRKGALDWQ